jgi:predicted  nucleic acid-binding Zn-ribbon protein
MNKTSGTKALVAAHESEAQRIENDLKTAKETRRRLRSTLEELHHAIHQVEHNLQSAKALLRSLGQNLIQETALINSAICDGSRRERRHRPPRFE